MRLQKLYFYILVFFILGVIVNCWVYGYEAEIEYIELVVYRDGLVHVVESLVVNQTYPVVNIKLLASRVENVLVFDENNSLLDYRVTNLNLTIFSLGARRVLIEYDTFELTSMEAGVWTLMFNSPFNLTVKLPEGATIVYLSNVPMMISVEENRTVLYLSAGKWEISYVLPITIPAEEKPTKPTETKPPEGGAKYPSEFIFLGALLGLLFFLGGFLLYRRRKAFDIKRVFREHPELREEERKVLKFIVSRGGRVFEAELRKEFPEIPRTTLWRMIKRMERMGILHVRKIGLQNQVELAGK